VIPGEPLTTPERILQRIWSRQLGLERVGVNDSFATLGGDSLVAVQIASEAQSAGLEVTVGSVLKEDTIQKLARYVDRRKETVRAGRESLQLLPLTATHREILSDLAIHPNSFCIAVLLTTPPGVHPESIRRSLLDVIAANDALRTRMRNVDNECALEFRPDDPELSLHFGVVVSSNEPPDLFIAKAVSQARQAVNAADGVVVSATLIDLGSQQTRLCLVASHFVVDAFGMGLLVDALRSAWRRQAFGKTQAAETQSVSYASCVRHRLEANQTLDIDAELGFWLRQHAPPLTRDADVNDETSMPQAIFEFSLARDRLHRLRNRLRTQFNATMNEGVIAAIVLSFRQWRPDVASICMEMFSHGRYEAVWGRDVSRALGLYIYTFPIAFEPAADMRGTLLGVQRSFSELPAYGANFGYLRCFGEDDVRLKLRELGTPQICYNNLGGSLRLSASSNPTPLFSRAPESLPASLIEEIRRWPLFFSPRVNADGELAIEIQYARDFFAEDSVLRLGGLVRDAFLAL